jgi:hypothetical protein
MNLIVIGTFLVLNEKGFGFISDFSVGDPGGYYDIIIWNSAIAIVVNFGVIK